MTTTAKKTKQRTITCTVDQDGRCTGFAVTGRAGSFGENLKVGQACYIHDYYDQAAGQSYNGDAEIVEVLSYIHTGSSGTANYVYVTIRTTTPDGWDR